MATFAVHLQTEAEAVAFRSWVDRDADDELDAPLMRADSGICAARADAEPPEAALCCDCDWDGGYTGPGGQPQPQPTAPAPTTTPAAPPPDAPPPTDSSSSPPPPAVSPPPSPPPPPPATGPAPPPTTDEDGCAHFHVVSLDIALLPPPEETADDDGDGSSSSESESSSAAFPYWTVPQESHYYYTTDPLLRRSLADAMGLADAFGATLQLAVVRFAPGTIPESGCGRGIRKFARYDALFADRAAADAYIRTLLSRDGGGLAGLMETLRARDPEGVCGAYAQLANRGRPTAPVRRCLGPGYYLQTTFQSSTSEYVGTTFESFNGRRRRAAA